ncbi:MAG: AlpA family phage regulatory protein [Burkholderiaceae bacterium]|jgi:prophage regulatory protein|nr:AlpA family phage regulatory protein [Burkholderiaceae bacterium]
MHVVPLKPPSPPPGRLWRLSRVEEETGLKKSTIYGLVRAGRFPAPIRITRRLSTWSEAAVSAWVQERVSEGGAK